jgi:tetratricopeptide (TPR) repeat protein
MGTVYLAVRAGPSGFTKLTVVKCLRVELARDPRYLHMFLDEARISARLSHPNIVQTNDVVQDVVGGTDALSYTYSIEMEYLEGVSLQEALGLVDVAQGVFVLAEVLAGLHYAHELTDFEGRSLRCVHRDVSPSNVVLTYDGGVKLIDFGVAKTTENTFTTGLGLAKGKLVYMAPEQALGLAVDRRADVFAVGAILYRVLSGKDMWGDRDDLIIAQSLRDGEVPKLDASCGADPSLVDACNRALAWHPDQRFESAHAMRLVLEHFLEEKAPRTGARGLGERLATAFAEERKAFRADVDRLVRGTVGRAQEPPAKLETLSSAAVTTLARIPRAPVVESSAQSGVMPRAREELVGAATQLDDAPPSFRASLPPSGIVLPKRAEPSTPPAPFELGSRRSERLLTTVLHVRGFSEAGHSLVDWVVGTRAVVRPAGRGAFRILVRGKGGAREQVTLAARMGLLLHGRPGVAAAMATSVTEPAPDGEDVVGAAVDVAAKLVRHPSAYQAVLVDSLSTALLDAQFLVETKDDVCLLRGARDPDDVERRVHGREAPFLGRGDALRSITETFAAVLRSKTPRLLWIAGEPGLGKSRLLRETRKKLAEAPPGSGVSPAQVLTIWSATSDPLAAGAPYRLVRDLVGRVMALDPTGNAAQKRAVVQQFTSQRVARDPATTSVFLCELLGVPFDTREPNEQLRAARADARLMHEQLGLAFAELVRGELQRGPLVIALDDVHSADAPSLELLRRLLDIEAPLLVLAFSDIPRGKGQLESAVSAVVDVVLTPLSKHVAVQLAHALLPAASVETAEQLAEASAGSPLHLEELARAHVARVPPSTVLAMTQARLSTLPDLARRVLRTASVIGLSFESALLGTMLPDIGDDALAGALDGLVRRELLVERNVQSGRELSFRNALVREASYSTLTEADRIAAHARAAEALEARDPINPLAVAQHHTQAGHPDRAGPAYLRAAQASLAANDVAEAIALAGKAEESNLVGDARGRLEALRTQIAHFRGENQQIVEHARRAFDLLPPGSSSFFDVLGWAGVGAGAIGDRAVLERCELLLRETSPIDERANVARLRAMCRVAGEMHSHGQGAAADGLLTLLDDFGRDVFAREPSIAAMRAHVRAGRALARGDNESALGLLHAAVDALETAGDLRLLCAERCNASYAASELGLADQAQKLAREAIAAAERAGIFYVAYGARANLALALLRAEKWQEAADEADRAARYASERGERYLRTASLLYHAIALMNLGDLDAAESDARACIAAEEFPSYVAHGLAVLAQIRLRKSDASGAMEHTARGMEILHRVGGLESGESLLRLVFAQSLAAAGQEKGAKAALADARARLKERAEAIRDEATRDAYLAIAEHRETLKDA